MVRTATSAQGMIDFLMTASSFRSAYAQNVVAKAAPPQESSVYACPLIPRSTVLSIATHAGRPDRLSVRVAKRQEGPWTAGRVCRCVVAPPGLGDHQVLTLECGDSWPRLWPASAKTPNSGEFGYGRRRHQTLASSATASEVLDYRSVCRRWWGTFMWSKRTFWARQGVLGQRRRPSDA